MRFAIVVAMLALAVACGGDDNEEIESDEVGAPVPWYTATEEERAAVLEEARRTDCNLPETADERACEASNR